MNLPPLRVTEPPRLAVPEFDDDLEVYPEIFPVPDRSPYSYAVDMGVLRSEFAAGNARQRRAYTIMPHMLALSFHMRVEALFVWQTWVNRFAYSYFHCPVSTMYAGQPPDPSNIRYETLRFAGDLAVTSDGWNWMGVTVAAELANDAYTTAPPVALGGWIIGGRPATPAPDWIVGRTPGAPPADWIEAGTPEFPAAY